MGRPTRAQRAPAQTAECRLYFANVTSWSVKAVKFMAAKGRTFDIGMFVEHHLRGQKLVRERRRLQKEGWSSVAAQAALTEKGGTSGGAVILARSQLETRRLQRPEAGALEGSWAGMFVRLCGVELLVVTMYLRPEAEADNLKTLEEVTTAVRMCRVPFVLLADWNQVPSEITASLWPESLGAVLVEPAGTEWTCNQGKKRMLDFACVSSALAPLLAIVVDDSSPWTPHLGLEITISMRADWHMHWRLATPRPLPVAAGPARPFAEYLARAETEIIEVAVPFQVAQEAASYNLTVKYARLSRAFEHMQLDRAGTSQSLQDRRPYLGRGLPPLFVFGPAVARVPAGASYKEPALCFWSAVLYRLRLGVGRFAAAVGSDLAGWLCRAAADAGQHWVALPCRRDGPEAADAAAEPHLSLEELTATLAEWPSAGPRQRARAIITAKGCEAACFQRAASEARSGFRTWLKNSLSQGGGAAHAWAKLDDHAFDERLPVEVAGDLAETADFWDDIWAKGCEADRDPSRLPGWLRKLREQVKQEDHEPIADSALKGAVRAAPAAAGKGLDLWRAAEFADLPEEGLHELGDLIRGIEEELAWPCQALCVKQAKLLKPGGGHRLIALTAGLYRTWSLLRRPSVKSWEQQEKRTAFWDAAVSGSSCLLVALARAVKAEAAQIIGASMSQALWDIKKFFDSIRPQVLVRLAEVLGYPKLPLLLGLLVHRAVRVIFEQGQASRFIVPLSSILAGCMQSTSWSKVYFHDILEEAHNRYRPVEISTWVDDLNQMCLASRATIVSKMVAAGAFLKGKLEERGCFFADKSFVISTDRSLTEYVVQGLKEVGFEVQGRTHGRDIGLDTTMGTARRLHTVKGRSQAATGRLVKAGLATKVNLKARALATTGAWPKIVWGRAGHGTSPSELGRIRARVAAALEVSKAGGCTTTGFEVNGLLAKDPAYLLPLTVVSGFMQALLFDPSLVAAATKALGKTGPVLRQLGGAALWARARGPITAFVATLAQAGWSVEPGPIFVDDTGQPWEVDPGDPASSEVLLRVFAESLRRAVWAKAAEFNNGRGAEGGVDFEAARRNLRSFARHGHWREAGALRCCLQGAVWTDRRLQLAGYQCEGECSFCGEPNTDLHFFWTCRRHADSASAWVREAADLSNEAAEHAEQMPAFWLRGLPPQAWYDDVVKDYPSPEMPELCETGCFANGGCIEVPPGAFAATDGSGGEHSSDPRLRRAGFGLCLFAADFAILGTIYGTVAGPQTVNRAELVAVLVLLARTTGRLQCFVDSAFVLRPFATDTDPIGGRVRHHLDVWGGIHRLRSAGGRDEVQLIKVKSHLGCDEALAQGHSLQGWFANLAADKLALQAANRAALPPEVVNKVAAIDLKAKKVQRRLAAILAAEPEKPRRRYSRRVAEKPVQPPPSPPPPPVHPAGFRRGRWSGCTACLWSAWDRPLPSACHLAAKPGKVHHSHSVVQFKSIWVCLKCGGWAKQFMVKLAKPCKQPTHSGAAALAAIARGEQPQGLLAW